MSAYIDESYNGRVLCVGGWLALDMQWNGIERLWKERIQHERRLSIKRGFPPISRYHATDCANLKNEFSEEKGWDIPRQIRLSKKLIEIVGRYRIAGIVGGGGIADFVKHFPGDKERCKDGLYYFSVIKFLALTCEAMKKYFPNERVSVFYERGQFGGMAQRAFDSLMSDPRNADCSKYFVTMAPLGWEDCVPLQPADLMAYEGLKRVDGSLRGEDNIRRSLQALMGKNVSLTIGHFTDRSFGEMVANKKAELEKNEIHGI
jgi:hypothetical protein